jgi:hypothetical protein
MNTEKSTMAGNATSAADHRNRHPRSESNDDLRIESRKQRRKAE